MPPKHNDITTTANSTTTTTAKQPNHTSYTPREVSGGIGGEIKKATTATKKGKD